MVLMNGHSIWFWDEKHQICKNYFDVGWPICCPALDDKMLSPTTCLNKETNFKHMSITISRTAQKLTRDL